MKTNFLLLFTLLTFVNSSVYSSENLKLKGNFVVKSADITYNVHFLLKHVKGHTSKVKGKGICKASECKFLIATPVKSFISKDSNRDTKMLGVVKAGANPMILVRLKTNSTFKKKAKYDLEVSMAGVKKIYKDVSLNTIVDKNSIKVSGILNLHLADFKIIRPSLLMIKIKDLVPVDINILFTK